MITRKIATEDRLVMGDPVTEQVQPFHSLLDIGTDAARVTLGGMAGERRCEGRHPQGRWVGGDTEKPPEPESEFGDDTAVRWRAATATARALHGSVDGIALALAKQQFLGIPRLFPAACGSEVFQRSVKRVAEDDLEPTEVCMHGTRHCAVPVVQAQGSSKIACSRVEIGPHALNGEALHYDTEAEGRLLRR